MKQQTNYVLITGAGAGLGRCLALEMAKQGHSLILVSLLQEELNRVKAEIAAQHPSVAVETLALDVMQPNAADTVDTWLTENNIALKGLVNNVGMGYTANYEVTDAAFFQKLLQLNIVFTHSLTHKLIHRLIGNPPAFILNVASMAAFFPLPYKALYSASKSFILTFSKALRAEMWDNKVQVSCLCPGPMITNNEVRERIKNIGWRKYITNISEPEEIAQKAVKGLAANKAVILPTLNDKITVGVKRIIPAPILSWLLRVLSKNTY